MKRQILRALLGLLATAIATSLQWGLWPFLGTNRFILLYPAIIIVSLLGGMSAGLVCTVFSALSATYFFYLPIFNVRVEEPYGGFSLSIFIASGVLISAINEILQRRSQALVKTEIQRKANERFRLLFESSPNALVAMVDQGGTIVMVNSAVKKIFGYHPTELVGQKIEVLVPETLRDVHVEHRKMYMMAPIPRVLGVSRDLFGRRKDGSEVPLEIALSPIRMEEEIIILATITDISERKRMEADLSKAFQEAKKAVQIRDEFLSIASHELKTPLTSLTMQIQLISRLIEKGSFVNLSKEYTADLLSMAMQQLERFSILIDDLLDVSRIGAGRLTLTIESVDLSSLVHKIVNEFQSELRRMGYTVELRAERPVIGAWDSRRIEQIIINLLSNAMKYGGGKPIEITAQIDGENARLTVRDHGIGIPPSDQERIFQPYERAVSSKSFGGLGLGLYITRKLVEAHQGSIRVESKVGQGANFIVELPLAPHRKGEKAPV